MKPNKEYVTLNPVFLEWNMIFISTLEQQSDRLSDPNNPNFAKPSRLGLIYFGVETENEI